MCGLTGVYTFTEAGKLALNRLRQASEALRHRGPDAAGILVQGPVGLAHRRLSIIDPAAEANQPFTDATGRYTIIYNGEVFNYRALRQELQNQGIQLQTTSDTEVILELYKQQGPGFLHKLAGFFAMAIYDAAKENLFIARDRYGEKPLLYYQDENKFLFGSELGALLALGVPRTLDSASLLLYLQLTYVPAPGSMLIGVKKLLPGHSLTVSGTAVVEKQWYQLPYNPIAAAQNTLPYALQQQQLKQLLEQAVSERLVADVPVGAFLSGGVDSSVVVALASQINPRLKTFAVGFPESPFFDETRYARLVAERYKTDHHEILLRNQDLHQHLFGMLSALTEPFADSSALAVYALSRHAGQEVKAVLSGDGADELFAGYNKHWAEYKVLAGGAPVYLVKHFKFLWDALPSSRNSSLHNKVRQLQRFSEGLQLSDAERYWHWASWQQEHSAMQLLMPVNQVQAHQQLYTARKQNQLQCLSNNPHNLNNVLCADWQLVLANDMLVKIDSMGMANGLEIRSPFLDHRLVEFAFSLPAASKIDATIRKKILQETFRSILPQALYKRPKKGFEVPLLAFLQSEGQSLINDYLADGLVAAQGVFNVSGVREVRKKINASPTAATQTQAWMLLVFQYWWTNNITAAQATP